MNKVLIVNSGLKHSQAYIDPYLKRIAIYLQEEGALVDVRDTMTFDERVCYTYDQIIFIFLITMNSIPSTTLEIFQKLENQKMGQQQVYSIIICDEFETETCDVSERIVKKWCNQRGLTYKGTMKIGAGLIIMKNTTKYVVANQLKKAAKKINNDQLLDISITFRSQKNFLNKANQYWVKQNKKKKKELKKLSQSS